ncbi:MAG: hypothetical protein IK123_06350, partial [Lachnospiraceae bacterium]|nr:hypothetical protein [Lachnospiraceae bacterium]
MNKRLSALFIGVLACLLVGCGEPEYYPVAFYNYNGLLIDESYYRIGELIYIPDMPECIIDGHERWFMGWDKEPSEVCEGYAKYTAQYGDDKKHRFKPTPTPEPKEYTID